MSILDCCKNEENWESQMGDVGTIYICGICNSFICYEEDYDDILELFKECEEN
jgi:hypothetical protein